jgi:hypothetical protein
VIASSRPKARPVSVRRVTSAPMISQGLVEQIGASEWPGAGTPLSIRLRCGNIQRIAFSPRLSI